MPLGVVTVQQPVRCPTVECARQLPAQVDRVLDAQVESLPARRRMNVRGIAGQQHPADAVALGEPGGIAEAGQPARRVRPEIRPGQFP